MKLVFDTNVLAAAINSSRARSANRRVFELIVRDEINFYTCDVLLGELTRVYYQDPKLSKINGPYLHARMDEIVTRAITIPTIDIDEIRNSMDPKPFLLKNGRERNDMYVVAVGIKVKARYILTYDNNLSEIVEEHFSGDGLEAITPKEFISKEWKEYW